MSIVQTHIDSVASLLQSVAEFSGGKVFHVLSDRDLSDKVEGVVLPAVGILYEGLRGRDAGGGSHKTGQTAELAISLLIFMPTEYPGQQEPYAVILGLLGRVRDLFKDTRSPGGHFWRFVVETAAVEREGVVVWIQRWSVPVQLHQTS